MNYMNIQLKNFHAIEEYLNELNELCNSETFYAWRDEFEILKGSF